MAPVPITIITGFLGSGKTTILLNLIPQLPKDYKLALLKNEFGDLAIDSQLASSASISGVRELLNGCICCNLVGQLGDALETLRTEVKPARIMIETSGSAFPATLVLEVNRISGLTHGEHFSLDGVISVVDVENWQGYEDTSITAKMQAKYTDLVILNKWEHVSERRLDLCLDRLGDLDVQTPWVKSASGKVDKDILLGIDGGLARSLEGRDAAGHARNHMDATHHPHIHRDSSGNASNHQSEVDVLTVTLGSSNNQGSVGLDLGKLDGLLTAAPKDEIYRIKAVLFTSGTPICSNGERVQLVQSAKSTPSGSEGEAARATPLAKFILNWAFGRWTYTAITDKQASSPAADNANGNAESEKAAETPKVDLDLKLGSNPPEEGIASGAANKQETEPTLRMTIITARYESTKWKRRIQEGQFIAWAGDDDSGSSNRHLNVEKVV